MPILDKMFIYLCTTNISILIFEYRQRVYNMKNCYPIVPQHIIKIYWSI